MSNSHCDQGLSMAVVGKKEQTEASALNQPENSQEQDEENSSALELAYKDQAYHEMEFTSGNESQLHERKEQCLKNPGHLEFIPASKFTLEDLPGTCRDSLVFDYITAMIDVTIRLAVKHTSKDRPSHYPLYNRRGQYGLTAYGTGRVCSVYRKFKVRDGRTCPCKACKQSPDLAKTQWGQFGIFTACHVVFDSSEARHTRADLFVESDEEGYDCPSLEGVDVVVTDVEMDHCWMTCVTHNEEVSNKLKEMISRYRRLQTEVRATYKRFEQMDQKETAVVISHPHGLCKYVTVGEVLNTSVLEWSKWLYSAETCTGSSGAPVCILADRGGELTVSGPYSATHSGCQQKGQNESTGMWL